jgi:hypothetical protein
LYRIRGAARNIYFVRGAAHAGAAFGDQIVERCVDEGGTRRRDAMTVRPDGPRWSRAEIHPGSWRARADDDEPREKGAAAAD